MTERNDLAQLIKCQKVMLFAGAGVSMNLNLPNWDGLIEKVATELGFDAAIFSTFGDNYLLTQFYKHSKKKLGPLRSWMDREWGKANVESSEIHQKIVELDFPIIYTTNYDNCIELAHTVYKKDYCKVASIADIPDIVGGRTQIVKFHGDFADDESIVLTEDSYFERMTFDSQLDLKLQSDMMRYGILFMGYSMTDINIRFLIYKMDKLWKRSPHVSQRPRSFFFLTRPNAILSAVLEDRGITPITSAHDDPTEGLSAFLSDISNCLTS
jgi:hypothetical protein